MRNLKKLSVMSLALLASAGLLCSAAETKPATTPAKPQDQTSPVNIKIVNFKKCVEASKLGKQEQANFENLKKQMDKVMEEKENSLAEISNKFNDPDYLDSLTPEAENELKHKYRTLTQDYNQLQAQCYQGLQQANMKIVQNLQDEIAEAAEAVAKRLKVDIVCNEEACFFYNDKLDISDEVIKELDERFKNQKDNAPKETK